MTMTEMPRPVALVTGGTGGVGRSVCEQLAARGHDVAFTFHSNAERAAEVSDVVSASGVAVMSAAPDLTCPAQTDEFVESVVERFGKIDVVIHAAGPYVDQRFVSTFTSEQFRRHVDAELTAFFELVRATLPHLRASRGSLTAVTTMALRRFPARDALSSVPKGGIEALVHAVAVEEGRHGVRANAVGPGVLEDGMGVMLAATGDVPPSMRAQVERAIPLKRLGQASEVAAMVCFLAAEAHYVTGQRIDVDGGYQL
ncbi:MULTISPECIES: SDR family NAD(P)-dependent oxidoreductase [unclassified Aeromicrobium]|uniref:SDR family NAD(P)-dependent oxidoreductase n=1 Tax=unclassified Aeromicrobium TaxID=2633570 RepID=UPI00396AF57E